MAGVLWPLLCPAVHSAGSTNCILELTGRGKASYCTFTPLTFGRKEGRRRESESVCTVNSHHIRSVFVYFTALLLKEISALLMWSFTENKLYIQF